MSVKTKILTILSIIIVTSVGFNLASFSISFADYTPQGSTCDDGSKPTVDKASGATTCPDSTKTPAGGQASGTQSNNQASGSGSNGTTCAVEKIGWLVCPIIEKSATLADKAFGMLASGFLRTDPALLSSGDANAPPSGTRLAWNQARNLANVAFVIAFVIVIYSQITGSGLNNYGIKRMLPRLIIAAIAVNISYWICQGMADLSNILGYNIMQALQDVSNGLGPSVLGGTSQGINLETSNWLGTIAVAALAVAGVVWFILPILGSVVAFVFITCIAVVFILLLRKAFIVLLVVISPFAFVAYLLPNTEKLFNKWLKMFWQLLLVFPIVALLMGGGQLASTIILISGAPPASNASATTTTTSCNPGATTTSTTPGAAAAPTGTDNNYAVKCEGTVPYTDSTGQKRQAGWTIGLVAAGVAVAPLLAVWSVLQGALSAAGAIGGKIGGVVNNMNSGAKGNLKKEREGAKQERSNRRALNAMENPYGLSNITSGGKYRRKAFKDARRAGTDAELKRQTASEVAERAVARVSDGNIIGASRYGRSLAGANALGRGADDSAQQRAVGRAQATIEKLETEELQAASVSARTQDDQKLRDVIDQSDKTKDVNDPKLAAAIQELAIRQDFKGLEAAIDKFGGSGLNLATKTLGSSVSQNNPGFFTAGNLGAMSRGALTDTDTYQNMAAKNIADGAFSPAKMAEASKSSLEEASFIAGRAGNGTHQKLTDSAKEVTADPLLRNKLSRNQDIVANMDMGNIRRSRPD